MFLFLMGKRIEASVALCHQIVCLQKRDTGRCKKIEDVSMTNAVERFTHARHFVLQTSRAQTSRGFTEKEEISSERLDA